MIAKFQTKEDSLYSPPLSISGDEYNEFGLFVSK